jgi:hypothetical protein
MVRTRVLVGWARPGMSKKVHAFAAGDTFSLCGTWTRTPTTPTTTKLPEHLACAYCWAHSRSRRFRDGTAGEGLR